MENLTRASGTEPRILLVEDSEDLRTLMALVLEDEGYLVDTARTAEEGLDLLVGGREYALILSDYALPGRTGGWLLHEAIARHLIPEMSGIIVTAHPNPREAAGLPVIFKPLDFDSFLDHIRALVPPGRPGQPAFVRQDVSAGLAPQGL